MFGKLISLLGFDNEKPNYVVETKTPQVKVDTTNLSEEDSIILQIHNEFDTAPDRLLQQAIQILEQEGNAKIELESQITEKVKRLEKLGFIKNDAVVKKQEIDTIASKKEAVIKLTTQEAEGIKYYSKRYPFLKFLTESELDRICEKYGLIYCTNFLL